ncbi:MAG: hypothetical protein Ta2A_25930 [Treponemataceae bacterium]|nr:MAG: hypothetical protein Ta2A_25930 [Treponemataceae bacterium]
MKKLFALFSLLILVSAVNAPKIHALSIGLSASTQLLFPNVTSSRSWEHETYVGSTLELTTLDNEKTFGVYVSATGGVAVTPPLDYTSKNLLPPIFGMAVGFGISAYDGERLSVPFVLAFHGLFKDAADATLVDIGILGKLAFRVKTTIGLAFVFQTDISFDMLRLNTPRNGGKTTSTNINVVGVMPGIGLQYTF